jgi:glucose-6-phosphate 1-dehydrogenase
MTNAPLTIVICGASGDLTSRKLIPCLFQLARKNRLPPEARIVGLARTPLTDDVFRGKLIAGAKAYVGDRWSDAEWNQFAQRIHYIPGDASKAEGLAPLEAWLADYEKDAAARRLFYLSIAPQLYPDVSRQLAGLIQRRGPGAGTGGWNRLIIEKPFGHDRDSARELNQILREHYREDQLFRIDHYLGKETVQNILVFRFANTMFEPLWNHNFIEHVQITVSETVPVGERGDYYDKSGILRDMFQNHLLQLLTFVTMESCARFAAEPLRNEKMKVLDAIPVPTVEQAARNLVTGQYRGYLQEKGVAPNSRTPTFAALELSVENWRWRGVPFYLRSGKAMDRRLSEVIIQFRCPPHLMFPLPPGTVLQCNRLSMTIQPDEAIHLNFQTKVPDKERTELQPVDMEFRYRSAFGPDAVPEAYERLLHDAITGDASLFMRADEIEGAWEILDPYIQAAEQMTSVGPFPYAPGTCGPAEAEGLLSKSGRNWISLCREGRNGRS